MQNLTLQSLCALLESSLTASRSSSFVFSVARTCTPQEMRSASSSTMRCPCTRHSFLLIGVIACCSCRMQMHTWTVFYQKQVQGCQQTVLLTSSMTSEKVPGSTRPGLPVASCQHKLALLGMCYCHSLCPCIHGLQHMAGMQVVSLQTAGDGGDLLLMMGVLE